jgi:hypothetical protein
MAEVKDGKNENVSGSGGGNWAFHRAHLVAHNSTSGCIPAVTGIQAPKCSSVPQVILLSLLGPCPDPF